MSLKTLTQKENTMNAKLKQAWRSSSERRRQYQIDRALYKMGGPFKKKGDGDYIGFGGGLSVGGFGAGGFGDGGGGGGAGE
jgi:hypothetical protein